MRVLPRLRPIDREVALAASERLHARLDARRRLPEVRGGIQFLQRVIAIGKSSAQRREALLMELAELQAEEARLVRLLGGRA